MIRILKITGRTGVRRRERLQQVEAWMAESGWRLADYAEDAHSAMFERPKGASPVSWKDSTRWLPGPQALKPREWPQTLLADPRWFGVPAVLLLVVTLGLLSWLSPPSFLPGDAAREQEQAKWRIVNTNQLNVREAPSRTAQQVGVLYRNQRVLIEGEVDDTWVRISVPTRGYVASRFLKASGGAGFSNATPSKATSSGSAVSVKKPVVKPKSTQSGSGGVSLRKQGSKPSVVKRPSIPKLSKPAPLRPLPPKAREPSVKGAETTRSALPPRPASVFTPPAPAGPPTGARSPVTESIVPSDAPSITAPIPPPLATPSIPTAPPSLPLPPSSEPPSAPAPPPLPPPSR